MSSLPNTPSWTYAEYLALERRTGVRHEYVDGAAYAMAGGTPRHAKLKGNLQGMLWAALGDGSCQAYDSDLKVRALSTGDTTYPDHTVVCGPLQRHPEDANAITNPTAVFEVLSKSTEGWDRGGKFALYRAIPTLRHYVLVGWREPRIEVFTRRDDGTWLLEVAGPGEAVDVGAIGVTLAVDEVFRNLPDPVADDLPEPPPVVG